MKKKCSGCREEMSLDKFYKNKSKPCGYSSYCKKCAKEYLATYRKESVEKTKARDNKYYRNKIMKQRQLDKQIWINKSKQSNSWTT